MINNWKKFLAIFMCVSMVANVLSFVGEVKAADEKWTKYDRNTNYTGTVTEDSTGVALDKRAGAYYKEKVTTQEGTKISIDVQFPTVQEGQQIFYGVGLTTAANSLHNQDKVEATGLTVEFVSQATDNVLNAGGAVRTGAGNRAVKVNHTLLTNGRDNIKSKVYNITFEKQPSTSDNSWVVTVKENGANGNSITMNISKNDIGHDVYAEGAYIVGGSLNSGTHAMKMNNPTVTQPDNPNPPVDSDDPNEKWTKYTGNKNYTGTVTEDSTGVVLDKMAGAYYNEKVTIQEGTKISIDVQFPTVQEGQQIFYGVGLTTAANSLNHQDKVEATGLTVEFVSQPTDTVLKAGASIRTGAGNRAVKVTHTSLTNGRGNIESKVYNITFEKQPSTSNNSWVVTVKENGADGNSITMNISKNDIGHDVYAEGAYIVGGSLNSGTHTMKMTHPTVTKADNPNPPVEPDEPDEPIVPEDPNAKWKSYTGSSSYQSAKVTEGEVTLEGQAAAYYKEKVTIQEGTLISMDVEIPTVVSDKVLQFAIGLTTGENSFHNADGVAKTTTMVTELVSLANGTTMTAGGAIRLPNTNRTPNVPIPATLTNGRENISTTKYILTFEKLEYDSDYSWLMTAKENKTGGKVVAMKVPADKIGHNVFDDGAYIIAGSMCGTANTMKVSNVKVGKAVKTAWEAVRGYAGADFTTSTNEAVTLVGGQGGAYRREAFKLENNSYISLQYEAKALTKNNSNDFYIMWLDKPSLANAAGDSGNGYALHMRTAADFSSFTLFLREVEKGKMGTDTKDAGLKIGGGTINASALNQKIDVKLTRRTQKLDGVQYYGSITVTVAGKSYVKQITMEEAKKVFGDLDKDLYLMAGNMNNIVNTFEVKDVKVAAIPFVESVAGLWKRIVGYSKENLGAIVNRGRNVDLHGQGAAYLSQATNGSMNLSFNMTELTNDYHNKFSFAILNKSGSFVNDGTSKADGFTVEFRSFDQFEKGYAVYVATVTNGKATDYEKLNDSIVLGDLSKSQFDISLERKSNGSWTIKVVDKTYSKTLSYTLNNSEALKALTPGNIHLSVGNAGIDMKATIGY